MKKLRKSPFAEEAKKAVEEVCDSPDEFRGDLREKLQYTKRPDMLDGSDYTSSSRSKEAKK